MELTDRMDVMGVLEVRVNQVLLGVWDVTEVNETAVIVRDLPTLEGQYYKICFIW